MGGNPRVYYAYWSLSIAIVKAIARSKRTRVDRVAYWPRETKAAKRLVYTVQLLIAMLFCTRETTGFFTS